MRLPLLIKKMAEAIKRLIKKTILKRFAIILIKRFTIAILDSSKILKVEFLKRILLTK